MVESTDCRRLTQTQEVELLRGKFFVITPMVSASFLHFIVYLNFADLPKHQNKPDRAYEGGRNYQ